MEQAVAFDRFGVPHLADPYPLYSRVREDPGVFYADAFGVWVVTRFDDVQTVLSDWRRFSSDYLIRTPHRPAPGVAEILAGGHPEVKILLNQDPPQHTRIRRLVSDAFSPRRVRILLPRIEQTAQDLVGAFAGAGSAELVSQLAWPLPLQVICELIGLPIEDAEQLRSWTDSLGRLTSFAASAEEQAAAARESVAFEDYLAAHVARQRRRPGDNLTADLLVDPGDGGLPLDLEQLLSLLILLVFAGHETTANLIGNALIAALADDAMWRRLASGDVHLTSAVIDETMRIDPPVQGMYRVAMCDVELSGVTIPAGAQVFALIGAGNHDPSVYAEPDSFRLDQAGAPHLGFGRGVHYCIGAGLAKAEARLAILTLAGRLPGLRLAEGFSAPYLPNLMHRGPQELRVAWT